MFLSPQLKHLQWLPPALCGKSKHLLVVHRTLAPTSLDVIPLPPSPSLGVYNVRMQLIILVSCPF